jgi:putative endonuclease
MRRPKAENVSVKRGRWGEEVAVEYLRRGGFEIIERNVKPVKRDERLEIDIIAKERKTGTLVFVEVKQHGEMSRYARRLQSINSKKKKNLRMACNAWRRRCRYVGAYRFDVIEIFGTPEGGAPIIDHIERVNLFCTEERFVKWS